MSTKAASRSSADPTGGMGRSIVVGLAGAALALTVWASIPRNLDLPWTSIRLAPAFALAQGLPLYSTPDQPPWVMVGYGPLYPVGYLPCVLAKHPVTAVTAATLLAHLYVFGPAALLCAAFARRLRAEGDAAAVHWSVTFLLFALLTHVVPSLTYVTAGVHADAPTLGLFLLACYGVLRADEAGARELQWLLAGGVAAGLSATCKVNLLAGVAALAVWVFRRWGLKRTLLFLPAAAVAVVVVYGWAMSRDGFAAVALNLRQPGRMPWFTFGELGTLALTGSSHEFADKLRAFATFARSFLVDYGAVALAILLMLPRDKAAPGASAARVIRFFLVIALIMLPASIASIAKYGGDVNSRALVSLPLALAAIFTLALVAQRRDRLYALAPHAALLGLSAIVALPLGSAPAKWAGRNNTTLGEAYAVISADPGRWYFPFDPLAHLLAEGRFRPNIDVVYSYVTAGSPVNESAFRSALPDRLRYVAVPPSVAEWGVSELNRLIPEYMQRDPQLTYAKHIVFSR